jgi:hypothetical protein
MSGRFAFISLISLPSPVPRSKTSYLGFSEQLQEENQNADNWNYKHRLWEFRYKIQYEEPLIKVVQEDPLILSWNIHSFEHK